MCRNPNQRRATGSCLKTGAADGAEKMPDTDPDLNAHQRASAILASSLATTAGGMLDTWVYLAHGHVFANAQTGNVALLAISLVNAEFPQALNHLASVAAFIAGAFASRQAGSLLKRKELNSRNIRLGVECVLLLALGFAADGLPDRVVIPCVGFIAGLQITSLSHIGAWSFNTGMTTGNLRGAVSAFSKALTGSDGEWPHALAMTSLCLAFGTGALLGAWLTPRLGGLTLLLVAALVATALAVSPRHLDPDPRLEEAAVAGRQNWMTRRPASAFAVRGDGPPETSAWRYSAMSRSGSTGHQLAPTVQVCCRPPRTSASDRLTAE